MEPGDTGIAAALGVGGETETEFAARIAQGFKIPDLGLDGGEVGHGFVRSWMVDCGWLIEEETQDTRLEDTRAVGGADAPGQRLFSCVLGLAVLRLSVVSGGGSGFRGGGIGFVSGGSGFVGSRSG